jgi:hypothetical protein
MTIDPKHITEADLGADGLTDEEREAGLAPMFERPEIVDTCECGVDHTEGN